MKTLADLHTYWRQQFDALHTQEDTPLRNLRILAWLSFQLPLALDTSVHFYKHIGEHWCDAVYTIMQYRFDNIIKSKMTEREGDCEYWDLRTTALIALNDAGANAITPVLQSEKNVGKIEAYKQQPYSLNQFLHSFFRNPYDLVAHEFEDGHWAQDKMLLFFSRVQHNTQRSDKVLQKAQNILNVGGFGSVGFAHDISDDEALQSLNTLLLNINLCEQSGWPQNSAGLNGCNIRFEKTTDFLGACPAECNTINLGVDNNEPSVFWHEWMHMLEERVGYTLALQQCPPQLKPYRQLAHHMSEINTIVRTIPRDHETSTLYFNPLLQLNECVEWLCKEMWFQPNVCRALCDDLNDKPPHPIYNIDSFKTILNRPTSLEQRDLEITALFNQWRNDSSCELNNGDLSWAMYYDKYKIRQEIFYQLQHNESNFVSSAKVLDWERTGSYWSQQNELLARAFETFVEDNWGGDCERTNVDETFPYFPRGLERTYVLKGFETFAQAFKRVWPAN